MSVELISKKEFDIEKRNKIIKRIVKVLITLVILCIVATIGIGNYFVNYAIARKGNGGDREVSESNEIAKVDSESQNIIDKNKNEEKKLAEEWAENIQNKRVKVKANDGITLKGTEYIVNENEHKWAIVLHGYRSQPKSVLSIGKHFSENGYNVLIPSMRACSESEGQYIGMGWLDKDDLKCWINLIIEQDKDAEIVLHGSSMGAATVVMVSGDELPSNVKCIIEDSGYTSVWDIFASEAKARFNLPTFPVLNMFQLVAKVRAGYDIKKASSLEQVKKCKIPMLFIHGDSDDFVPKYMCDELYEAANCKKEKLIISGAGHTDSKYKEPDTYYNKMFEFINSIN